MSAGETLLAPAPGGDLRAAKTSAGEGEGGGERGTARSSFWRGRVSSQRAACVAAALPRVIGTSAGLRGGERERETPLVRLASTSSGFVGASASGVMRLRGGEREKERHRSYEYPAHHPGSSKRPRPESQMGPASASVGTSFCSPHALIHRGMPPDARPHGGGL